MRNEPRDLFAARTDGREAKRCEFHTESRKEPSKCLRRLCLASSFSGSLLPVTSADLARTPKINQASPKRPPVAVHAFHRWTPPGRSGSDSQNLKCAVSLIKKQYKTKKTPTSTFVDAFEIRLLSHQKFIRFFKKERRVICDVYVYGDLGLPLFLY